MKKIISSLLISISIASCGFSPMTSSVPTVDKSGSYVFNLGQKQNGATISAKIKLSNLFKTKGFDENVSGSPVKTLADLKYIEVYLLALDDAYAGTDPLSDTSSITNITNPLKLTYDSDFGDVVGVKLTNIGETPTGKKYYIGVVAKDKDNNVISKDGGSWTASSEDSGLSLSSNSVSVDNMLVVSDTAPLTASVSLKDAVGAEVAANIRPKDGLGMSYSSEMLGFSTIAGMATTVATTDDFDGSTSNIVATDYELTDNIRGVASDSLGNVYFADETRGYIAMVNKSGMLSVIATGLDTPVGLAVNENGDVFVAENSATPKVTKFTKQSLGVYTKSSHNITSTNDISGGVYSIAFSKVNPNIVYVGSIPTITKLDLSTGQFSDVNVNIEDAAGLAVDSTDNLYISDFANGTAGMGKVVKYNQVTDTTTDIATGLNSPDGLVVDYTGNVYVAVDTNKINKYMADTWAQSVFAGNGTMTGNPNGALRNDAQIGYLEMLAIEQGKNLSGDPILYYVDAPSKLIRKIVP